MRKYIYYYETLVGKVGIGATEDKIMGVYFNCDEALKEDFAQQYIVQEIALIKEAKKQLEEYFEGSRKEFRLPLLPIGTEFQKTVWDALVTIPYGETKSYQDIAEMIGNPKGCRAVGNANNKNPISIFIPCHRVIGKSGKMVGYGGGINIKEILLEIEKGNS